MNRFGLVGFLVFLLLCAVGQCQVVQVTDGNVDSLITQDGEWLLEFYADWCGYCRKFAPKYEAAEDALADSSVHVGKVDVESSPGLAARFFVQRLPTVVYIRNHQVRVVPHDKTLDLVGFIQREEWQDIQPANGLTSPFSVVGNMVALTGRMVKWASSLSPVTMVVLMATLLGVVVILPIYMPREEEQQQQQQQEGQQQQQTAESDDTSPAKSSARATEPAPSTSTKQRKSKRID